MKNIFQLLILLISFSSFSQKTIDIIGLYGKQKINTPNHHITQEGNLLLVFKDKKVIYNSSGEKIKEFPFVSDSKDYYINSEENAFGYISVNDLFYSFNKNVLTVFSDYSKENSPIKTFETPVLEGLIGSKYNPRDKTISLGSGIYTGLKESEYVGMTNEDELVIASSYISWSKNSHGSVVADKEKYHSFVRILRCSLSTGKVSEEIILKDVFNIKRSDNTIVMLKIISSKNNSLKIAAISEGKTATQGFSGEMIVYDYNLESKEVKLLTTTPLKAPSDAVNVSALITKEGFVAFYDFSTTKNRKGEFYKFDTNYSTDLIEFDIPKNCTAGITEFRLYIDRKGKAFIYAVFPESEPTNALFTSFDLEGNYIEKHFDQLAPMLYIDPITEEELILEFEITDENLIKEMCALVENSPKYSFAAKTTNNVVKNEDGTYSLIKFYRNEVAPQKILVKFIPIGVINE